MMMKKKLKLTVKDRLIALDLLAEGKSIDQAVIELKAKHPRLSLAVIRRAYFPQYGMFCFNRLVGASRRVINKRKKQIRRFQKEKGKQIKDLFADPIWAAKNSDQKSRLMAGLHLDPRFEAKLDKSKKTRTYRKKMSEISERQWQKRGFRRKMKKKHKKMWQQTSYREKQMAVRRSPKFRKTASKRMVKACQNDPEIIRRLREGFARYHNLRQLKLTEMLESWGIEAFQMKSGKSIKPFRPQTPAMSAMAKERRRVVREAIGRLERREREMILSVFFSPENKDVLPAKTKSISDPKEAERLVLLKQALAKLAQDPTLAGLL